MSRCKFCFAEVLWAHTASGKRIALNPQSGYQGRYTISEGQDGTRYAVVLPKGAPASDNRYQAHTVSCPVPAHFHKAAK